MSKENINKLMQENFLLKKQIAKYQQMFGGKTCVDDSFIKGGLHVVKTTKERDNIPCCHRKQGMIVIVVGEDSSYKEYQLLSKNCYNNWRELVSSADESTVRLVSNYNVIGANLVTQLDLNQKFKEIITSLQQAINDIPPPVDISGKANTNASNLLQTDVISWRDALNVYSKSETYSKSEVNTKQEIEGILEDYVTETTFRDAVSGLETSKLDTPSNTVTNTTTYPFLVLTKANGVESARIAAGDVGKNVANAALTSINGAGLTLGADWNITSGSGFYFGLKGLLDKSADATWNRLIMTDASGRVAYTDGTNLVLNSTKLLTDTQINTLRDNLLKSTENFSVAQPRVDFINPPIINKSITGIQYVSLVGLNLFINNQGASVVKMINKTTLEEKTISNFQTFQTNTNILTFGYDFSTWTEGEWYARVTNQIGTTSIDNSTVLLNVASNLVETPINLTWEAAASDGNTINTIVTSNNGVTITGKGNVSYSAKSSVVATQEEIQRGVVLLCSFRHVTKHNGLSEYFGFPRTGIINSSQANSTTNPTIIGLYSMNALNAQQIWFDTGSTTLLGTKSESYSDTMYIMINNSNLVLYVFTANKIHTTVYNISAGDICLRALISIPPNNANKLPGAVAEINLLKKYVKL